MKTFLITAILVAANNAAEAQTMNLFACEDAVVRDNFFLPKDEKRLMDMIADTCSSQIEKAQDLCGINTGFDEDQCADQINNKLKRHYMDLVNDIMKENR